MRLPPFKKNRYICNVNRHKSVSTLELKLLLIEQLTKIDNEKLLSRIKNLIHAVWDCRQKNPA